MRSTTNSSSALSSSDPEVLSSSVDEMLSSTDAARWRLRLGCPDVVPSQWPQLFQPFCAYVCSGCDGISAGLEPLLLHSCQGVSRCSPRERANTRASANGRNCSGQPRLLHRARYRFQASGRSLPSPPLDKPCRGGLECQLALHHSCSTHTMRCYLAAPESKQTLGPQRTGGTVAS